MVRFVRNPVVLCVLLTAEAALAQQHKVDPRNAYERVLAVVPFTGTGTMEDPRRPLYAPSPRQMNAASRAGILAYNFVESDDGKFALVEFVAVDRATFNQILSDSSIKAFLKGKDKLGDVVAEFQKHKKNFDLSRFEVRLP